MYSCHRDHAVEGSPAVDALAKGRPLWVWILGGGAIVVGKFERGAEEACSSV